MADLDYIKEQVDNNKAVFVIVDNKKITLRYTPLNPSLVFVKDKALGQTSYPVHEYDEIAKQGRIVTEDEFDDYFELSVHDNKSFIGEQFRKGKKVYIIDDYEECALCYDPARPDRVLVKTKDCQEHDADPTNEVLFFATLSGKIVSEEEYKRY